MEFFDCNASYGADVSSVCLRPVTNVSGLLEEMRRAGVAKAMVYRSEQYSAEPVLGNALLAEDIGSHENLYGVWAIVPSHTREIAPPAEFVRQMKESRIFGWRLYPGKLRFLPKPFVLKDWLPVAVECRIPLFVNVSHGTSYEALAEILEKHPELIVILTESNCWPNDRMLRPFVSEFRNVYLDLSYFTTDRGIESFVGEYGAGRLLYGSAFPECYFGANMLMIMNAEISREEKAMIASGNLQSILEGVVL